MTYGTEQLIAELFRYQRAPVNETARFTDLRHNLDLCPAFANKCMDLVATLSKYHEIAADIQGKWDEGTDVVVRVGDESNPSFVCLQIKTQADIKKGLISRLVLQADATHDRYKPIEHYYIVMCVDALDNRNWLRAIHKKFATRPSITVVSPEYALAFLEFSLRRIDALVRLRVASGDAVIQSALTLADDMTPLEIGTLLFILQEMLGSGGLAVSLETIRESAFIYDLMQMTPDYERDWYFDEDVLSAFERASEGTAPKGNDVEDEADEVDLADYYYDRERPLDERLADVLDHLEGELLTLDEVEGYRIEFASVEPFLIILLDGRVRYEYEGNDLLSYALEVLAHEKSPLVEFARRSLQ